MSIVSTMLSPEFAYEHQFAKSEPIYIQPQNHSTCQTPIYSNYKTVFSSSSSSSACSTSSSPPSINNSKSLDYDNEEESVNARRQGRGNRFFPDHVVDILNKWFFANQEYPYPDENMTNILAREANISAKQVRKWFANKRVRSNKCYKQNLRTRLNSTPCTSNSKSRRTKSSGDQEMNDESSDLESSINVSLNQSAYPELFYENLIRNLQQQQQQFNLIQNAIYNSTVIANLLQSSPHLNISSNSGTNSSPNSSTSISSSPNSSGIVKRKTHLSNCFHNDQLLSESPIKSDRSDTDDSVFKQDQNFYLHQLQIQFQQLIQHQHQQQQQQKQQCETVKKPKVNFGVVSDLI